MFFGDSGADAADLDKASQVRRFRKNAKELIEYICDYSENIARKPVSPDVEPGYLRPLLPEEAPTDPESFRKILDDFEEKVMPGMLHWQHPDFYGYFSAGNSFPNICAEMLMTACGGVHFSWQAQPSAAELETNMLDWLGLALHLPSHFIFADSYGIGGGCTQPSVSDAAFSVFVSARHKTLRSLGCFASSNAVSTRDTVHPSVHLPKLICYASSEAHSSVEKAANLSLVEIRILDTDNFRVTGEILERAVLEDKKNGRIPFLFIGNAGSTGVVAFDDFESCGIVCRRHSLWFHVDGAYGLGALILPEMQYLAKGLEYVDSVVINPCKLLLLSIDCACLFVRNIEQYTNAWLTDRACERNGLDDIAVDYRHFGLSSTRRMRSLKLYFLFKYYGVHGLQEHVRKIIRLTKHFESLVQSDVRFRVTRSASIGVFCFRQTGATESQLNFNSLQSDYPLGYNDRINMNLLYRINKSRKLQMCPYIFRNKYHLRISVNDEFAEIRDIHRAWEIIQSSYVEALDDDWHAETEQSKPNPKSRRRKSSLSFVDVAAARNDGRRARKLSLTFGPTLLSEESVELEKLTRS